MAALWLLSGLVWADEKPVLPWVVFDAPPFAISKGPHAGQGIYEAYVRFYEQHMPEFHHQMVYVSISRMHVMLADAEKNFCIPALFRFPQYEDTRLYASFSGVSTPVSILTTRDRLAKFGEVRPIALGELLTQNDVIAGLARSRSYGPLDALINQSKQRPNVQLYPLQNQTTLFRMMLRGRIDYTLGSAYEAGYIGRLLDQEERFISLQIAESPPYIVAYPNCTRNAWGEPIIERINEVNTLPEFHLQTIATVSSWSDPDTAKLVDAAHRKAYRETHGRELPAARP